MMIDLDDDILQDFLVEAGEILEQLGEQLVELEQNPEDSDLLNAIFRGFHTVKGGAGFLNLTPMVEVCHRSEDVFNLLRNNELHLDSDMMDAFLRVLDILNEQFDGINNGDEPPAAEQELLDKLDRYKDPANAGAAPAAAEPVAEVVQETPAETAAQPAEAQGGDITDDEFEALLDVMQGKSAGDAPAVAATPAAQPAAGSDEISEDEFDALLDDLHGQGKGPTAAAGAAPAVSSAPASGSDEITEDEFDALLDDLHGKGKGPTGDVDSAPAAPAAPVAADSEEISEDEFDALLDDLHGKGKGPTVVQPAAAKAAPEPAAVKPAPEPAAEKPQPATAAKAEPAKKAAPKAETSVRVDTKRLDDIMNMVGELVLVRNRLSTLKVAMQNEEVSKAVGNLDIVTADLQSAVMKTRMQPIKKIFGRFPRVVRDLARSLKKEVTLELVGEETDLDKNLVEALADPMVHLVRNSVDHGIEMPDVREKAGKPRNGTVILSAAQEGDHILLKITDDGAGMDANVLRGKAVEKGIMDQEAANRLEDRECFDLIFAPGFSTKEEISDVSGRGVGMDVVKTRITQLNGSIEIDSKKGVGTEISVKLPLTLAILPTLMVKIGDRTFALPLSSVSEIFHLENYQTNIVDGQLTVMVREKAMPMFYLKNWLTVGDAEGGDDSVEQVVVAHIGNQRVGFVVNQVVGQEEVVIKPLGSMLHGLPGFAGATITGDGRIALILDLPSLLKSHVSRF